MEGRSHFFLENIESLNILSKMLELYILVNVLKFKTSESSKYFSRNSKFMIMDYLPCPCKICI